MGYVITFEKGKAAKSIDKMSREEIIEAGEMAFLRAEEKALKTGNKPVVWKGQKKTMFLFNSD